MTASTPIKRGFTSAVRTAMAADTVRPVNFVKLEFDSGHVFYNDSDRTLTFGGDDYLGAGQFAGYTALEEGSELQTYSVTCSMSGIPSDFVSLVLSETFQNRLGTIFVGFLNSSFVLIADPIEMFKGRINQMNIESGETAKVSLSIESRLVDWERPRVRRYNNTDQQSTFASDKGFEFVEQMVEKQLFWGRT